MSLKVLCLRPSQASGAGGVTMVSSPAAFEFSCAFRARRKICKTLIIESGSPLSIRFSTKGFPRSPQRPAWQEEVSLLPHDEPEAGHGCAREKHKLWSELERLIHPVSRQKNILFLSAAVHLPRKRGYGSEHPVPGGISHISRPS